MDTHIFIWYFGKSDSLAPAIAEAIRADDNEVYLSVVSLWEAIIKYRLGKLSLPEPPEILFPAARFEHGILNLDLTERCVTRVPQLPPLHRDPFDRAIIAQALAETMTIVTVDSAIRQYSVAIL